MKKAKALWLSIVASFWRSRAQPWITAKHRKSVSWILSFGICAVVALSVGWIYSRNTLFRLSEVRVNVTDHKVETWVRTRLLGYLGHSLFTIPMKDVEADVMQLKQIKKVFLRRHWPDKVDVELELRQPVALIWNQKSLWLVDDDGVLFQKMTTAQDLPVLRGFSVEKQKTVDWRIGEDFHPALEWLRSLLQVDDGALGYRSIDELVWEDERGLVIKSYENDLAIELGHENFADAWSRSQKAYSFLKARGEKVTHLDASYRSRVVGIAQPMADHRAPIEAMRSPTSENPALVR